MSGARPTRQWPEPARGWIAWSPASWRCGPGLWTNLARGRLEGQGTARDHLPAFEVSGADDLLYLPPVAPEVREARDARVVQWLEARVPLLVQVCPDEEPAPSEARTIVDLLPWLMEGEPNALERWPEGAAGLWPVLPGLTDRPDLQEEGCERLAALGVTRLQVIVPEIPPTLRRRLAEESPDAFDAIFHGGTVTEREVARIAARAGLEPFLERHPTGSPRVVRNREIAEILALVGELTLRLGDPMAEAQVFLRAARGAEVSSRDVAALVREGNLRLLEWIESRSAELVEEWVESGESSRLTELRERYLGSGRTA